MFINLITLILALSDLAFSADQNQYYNCCSLVASVLGSKVSYPDSAAYNQSLNSYWSQQEEQVTPCCIVSPTSAQDISAAIKALTKNLSCKFAVRSGGHTAQAGSANIENGVTIDLSALNEITLSANKILATVGPGQRWGNVYTYLQTYNLSIAGGRAGGVGVGGLTIGGGISYFAPRQGFTCDNVLSYQVVLADGSIIEATSTSYSDLYRALKGGSSNFGIVTQYTFQTFSLGLFWGGNIIYPLSTVDAQLQAFSNFISNPNYDENAAVMQSFGFAPAQGSFIVNQPVYSLPVVNPPVLQPFTSIQPQILSSTAISNISSFSTVDENDSPISDYQLTFATSFDQSVELLHQVFNIWNASCANVSSVTGLQWSISMQPINAAIVSHAAATGGNSLGLPTSFRTGSLVLAILSATWSEGKDTALVESAADNLLDNLVQASEEGGSFNRYIDLNHANTGQDPISGYGPVIKAQLQAVGRRYDPFGVFQVAMPGGFKLYD
ncbi:hypothetical protein G7Y89_g4636 [Cudoniella acicularis]|uniref:FAD-binding PCMH-type domain-containing protein n=1 Tax=Cudoniella acicularis TaxID=354080 RepID=A0A8H4W794_9HELO|nr:hypothetical protein G7Y89_g4636 [Cudoniella acicularis]